eukprot:gene24323-biopygen5909
MPRHSLGCLVCPGHQRHQSAHRFLAAPPPAGKKFVAYATKGMRHTQLEPSPRSPRRRRSERRRVAGGGGPFFHISRAEQTTPRSFAFAPRCEPPRARAPSAQRIPPVA